MLQAGKCASSNDVPEIEIEDDKAMGLLNLKSGQSLDTRIAPPSFVRNKNDTFVQIPELQEMFRVYLEPNIDQKILVQTGPDLQLIAYNLQGRQIMTTDQKNNSGSPRKA